MQCRGKREISKIGEFALDGASRFFGVCDVSCVRERAWRYVHACMLAASGSFLANVYGSRPGVVVLQLPESCVGLIFLQEWKASPAVHEI